MSFGAQRTIQGFSSPRRKEPSFTNSKSHLKILLAFLLGILIGRFGQADCSVTNNAAIRGATAAATGDALQGSIRRLEDVPFRNTAHTDKSTGTAVKKQQFLEPFVVPNLAGFSVATIQRNQTVELHSHRSMHEFFYVLEGSATFLMCDPGDTGSKQHQEHRVDPGTFVHFAPNCVHGIVVEENSPSADIKVLVAGVTVGD
mmetsp:Transcript_6269/g.14807  ORF Transcript_6269/g.14807 Transcript_6269/m.14807 type:complete len:201 (+) Transcript_6269:53-655(+)